MCDQYAHAWKVCLAETPPETLIEPTHSIVGVRRTLPIGNAVEEVSVICTLLPHAFHLTATWLKVAKVLLP